MDICFNCPHCGQHLSVEERGVGMLVNCPSCNQQVEVPRRAAPVNQIVAKESEAAAGAQPFEVQKVRERSFFGRVFGGSRSSDAEAAVENLIAERGLDNVDIAAIDNCLHQSGVRDKAVKALLLRVWRHAVERFVATDGTLDSVEAAFLDRLKSVLGLDQTEADSERDSVLTAEFIARASPLMSRSDAVSEETRSAISRLARQLRISPDKQKSLLKSLARYTHPVESPRPTERKRHNRAPLEAAKCRDLVF
jgi:hypothetical protein